MPSAKSLVSAGFCAVFLLAGATVALADDTGPTFTFGSSVSFAVDINQPRKQNTDENRKTYADGESEESFNIDLVQIGVSGTRSIVSYGAKFDFGDWSEAVDNDIDDEAALQEMYLAVDAGFAVFSAGRIPTPIGYEVVEPWADPNISRSRAWFYQPISHDGVAVAGVAGPVSMMAAVVNGFHTSDNDQNNPDDEYGVIASIGSRIPGADLRLSAIYSDEKDSVRKVELNGVISGSRDHWRYGLEGTWFDGDGHSHNASRAPLDATVGDVTGYGGATFGHWSGDMRLSWTDQKGTNKNFERRNHENIVSFTLTGGYQIVEGVVLRAEYRVDSSSDRIFDDHNSYTDKVTGPYGQTDLINVVNVQLMWTPATGQN